MPRDSRTVWRRCQRRLETKKYARQAMECIAFEDSTFDAAHRGWADLREHRRLGLAVQVVLRSAGIGLARIAMTKHAGEPPELRTHDIDRALDGVQDAWPASTDTLCCGTLGSIEFLTEACDVLDRDDLRQLAVEAATGCRRNTPCRRRLPVEQGDQPIQPRSVPRYCRYRLHDDAGESIGRCPTSWYGSRRWS